MENNSLDSHTGNFHPVIQTIGISLLILGIVLLGQTLGGAIGILLYSPDGIDLIELASKLENSSDKAFILFLQGSVQLFTFFILPFVYIYNFRRNLFAELGFSSRVFGIPLLLMILLFIALIPIINITSEWNQNVNFPDFGGLEAKLIALEESAKRITDVIVTISGTKDFILTMVIVAIIPAVGEELLFRGVAQNLLKSVLKNPHLAIWIAAFLFSFVHFQFFGFLPRMILGVVFGYLYFWSRNLLVPIIMHFLNNFLALVSMHLYKEKSITVDPESADIFPAWAIILSLVMLAYLLSAFKKYNLKDTEGEINS